MDILELCSIMIFFVFVWDDECFEDVLLGFGREFDFVGLCLELELKLQEFL